jgi:hypothetical protein
VTIPSDVPELRRRQANASEEVKASFREGLTVASLDQKGVLSVSHSASSPVESRNE